MNEVVRQPVDPLILEAVAVEESLSRQVRRYGHLLRKISSLLEEKELNPTQRQTLEHLLQLARGDVGEE